MTNVLGEKKDLMGEGARNRAAEVTITDEHLDKMARVQDGAAEIVRMADAFRVVYNTVVDKFDCKEEYPGEEDGLHVIFDQIIKRCKEIAEQVERESLEFWGGFRTMLEEAEKAAPAGGES